MAGSYYVPPVLGAGGVSWVGAVNASGMTAVEFPGFIQGVNFKPASCLVDNTMNSQAISASDPASGKQTYIGPYSIGAVAMSGNTLILSGYGYVKLTASSKGIEIVGNSGIVRTAGAGVGGATKTKTINKSLLAYDTADNFIALDFGEAESYVSVTNFSYSFGTGGGVNGFVRLSLNDGNSFITLVEVQNGVVISPVPGLPFKINMNAFQKLLHAARCYPNNGSFTMTLNYQ